jgi:sugar phosphate isomerase/epimerase
MRIGLVASFTEDDLRVIERLGLKSAELVIAPGSALDPARVREDELRRARERLDALGIEISAIGYYANNLDPNEKVRQQNIAHLRSLMRLCPILGTETLCTFAGRVPEKDIPENIPLFKGVFAPLACELEERGLRLAFENCPMFHHFPFRGINIAYTPRAWDLMFDAVQSRALGLEFDPSHLVCLLIDYLAIVREYGSRIFHVHAKDAEVVQHVCERDGILEPGAVRHRMPGLGSVDWARLISALCEGGYRGNLDIEGRHDPVFKDELEEEGLRIAVKHLSQFVPE